MGKCKCGKPRQVQSVVSKWAEDKWNLGVVRKINNQTPALGLAHECRCALMILKGMSIRSEANFCSCKQSIKKTCNWG